MSQYIGCDAHKQYSVFVAVDERGRVYPAQRVEHVRAAFRDYLQRLPPSSPIALETMGTWYWIVDEMEQAGHHPQLTHARKAKLMMGLLSKSDKLDARGLAILLRNGTLPTVWIPPGELRDQRELPRMRMALVHVRTLLKNRIHASFAKYGITFPGVSDVFAGAGRTQLNSRLAELPPETCGAVQEELRLLDTLSAQLERIEAHIRDVVQQTPAMQQLATLPGVGPILATVLALEIGDVRRFPGPGHLASYSGTVPRLKESGNRHFKGQVRSDVNRYVKWALVEAANISVLHQEAWATRHTVRLYRRIYARTGHAKAVVAVARHLAEAAYWILTKEEAYREPGT